MPSAPLLKERKIAWSPPECKYRVPGLEIPRWWLRRRNHGCFARCAKAACGFLINRVKDLADHMERRREIRPAIPDKEPDIFAHFRGEVPCRRPASRPRMKTNIYGGRSSTALSMSNPLQALVVAVFAGGVELSLHPRSIRDPRVADLSWIRPESSHTCHCRMWHPHRRCRAVIHVQARIERFEGDWDECPGAVNDEVAPPPGPVTACRSMYVRHFCCPDDCIK